MTRYQQNLLIFAARYAHSRKTGAALMIVNSIIQMWDELDSEVKRTLIEEAEHATCNFDDWNGLIEMEMEK